MRLQLKNRLHNSSIKHLILVAVVSMPLTTVSAAPPVVDGATATNVIAADNGVPIVNIAKPNADGVSRNTYSDFNVDAQGIILNNADNIGVSQLGGAIIGNSNFSAGDGASIILNEVSSNQISNLNGYVETFGKRAEFILANPNGITCNGCGFINTSRATLITGSELNSTGVVGAFGLGSGNITFTGAGLNGENLSFLDVISRAVNIQAELRAKKTISIKTGNSGYDYASKTVSSNSSVGSGIAIDASLLGSMYAGQIELITTEAGVGVRSDGTLTAQQNVTLNSSGNVNTAAISAGASISINAAGNVTQTGDYLAGDYIKVDGANLNLSNIKGGTATLTATAGDITLLGAVFSSGAINLTATNIVNKNQLAARGDLTVNASGNLTNDSGQLLFSGANLKLNIDGTVNNSGDLYAVANLTAGNQVGDYMMSFNNYGGRIESGANLSIKALQITNSHDFIDNTAPTDSTQRNRVTILVDKAPQYGVTPWDEQVNPDIKRGLIQAGGNITLDAGTTGSITNNISDIYAAGNLNLNANTITNTAYALRTSTVSAPVYKKKCGTAGRWNCKNRLVKAAAIVIATSNNNIGSSIQAAGKLTMTTPSGGVINNSVPIVGNMPGAGFNGAVVDPIAGISLPGEGGFFKTNPAPDKSHPYLIVTDPALLDISKLYGSDYFLNRNGLDKTGDQTLFLGDAFYDQRLVANQIRLLTGQRYLLNAKDDNEQYQQLADAASKERERLGLKIGVALNLEQQEQLQENILWYVETTVGDKTVLVPRVYLSKANRNRIAKNKGALIQGQEVVLDSGNVLNEGAIISGGALQIKTEDQFKNNGGTIAAETSLSIASGGDLISTSRWWSAIAGSDVSEGINRSALIKSGGNLDLNAQGDIELIAGDITSNGTTKINSVGDLSLAALKLENRTKWRDSSGKWNYRNSKIDYATTTLKSAGNLVLSSLGDLLIEGSDINTEADANLSSGGSVQMLAVKSSDKTVGRYTKKKRWSKSTSTSLTEKHRYRSATLIAKKSLTITAQDNVLLFASQLKSGADSKLHSELGSIALISGINRDFKQQQYSKKGFSYSKKSNNGQLSETLSLASLDSGGHSSFTTGASNQNSDADGINGNVIISGAKISSAGNMVFGGTTLVNKQDATFTLNATDASRIRNLVFNSVALNNNSWAYSQKKARGLGIVGKVFTGGEIIRVDKVAQGERKQQGSVANAGGHVVANTRENIRIIGSTITASGTGKFDALGDIDIIAALNRESKYQQHILAKANGISFDWDGSRASVGIDADYKKTVSNQTLYSNQGSVLNFGGNLNLKSDNDIVIAGSLLQTSSSLSIDAKRALSVMSVDDILDRAEKITTAQARFSVGVGNAYLDVAQSIGRLKAAKNKVKQAKQAYSTYKAELKQMQADLKKGLVTKDDIRLRKEDKQFYVANIALSAANLVNVAIQVTKAGTSAIAATASYGFYADVKLELNGSKTKKSRYQSNSIASNLIAKKDMNLIAGDSIHVRGSNLQVEQNLSMIAGDDIVIEAARNKLITNTKRNSFNVAVSVSTAGSSDGIKGFSNILNLGKSGSVGLNNSFDKSNSVQWRNSTIVVGKKLTLKSEQDVALVGANVKAHDIAMSVKGDLTLQSRQNTLSARGDSFGLTVGTGSSGLNAGRRQQSRRWVDSMTSLVASNAIDIQTGGKTEIIGALLAQINTDGSDGGNLKIKTQELITKDLIDYDNASNWNAGFSTSLLGVNKFKSNGKAKKSTVIKSGPFKGRSSIKLSNNGYVRGQKTLATLGSGSVSTWNNKAIELASINRDINATQLLTANRKTGGLNVDVAIDHRMLTIKGWKDIAKDTRSTIKHARDVISSIALIAKSEKFGLINLGQVIRRKSINTQLLDILKRNNNKILKGIKSDNAQQSLLASKALAQLAQAELGLSLSDILFYDSTKTRSKSLNRMTVLGALVTGDSTEKNNIFINAGGVLTKKSIIETLLHEVYEQEHKAGKSYLFFKTKNSKKEALADLFGEDFTSRFNKKKDNVFNTSSEQWKADVRGSKLVAMGTLRSNKVKNADVEYRMLHVKEIELINERAIEFAKYINTLPNYRNETGRHDGRPSLQRKIPRAPTEKEIIEAKRRLLKAALRVVSGDFQYKYKQFHVDLAANKFLNKLRREKIAHGNLTVNGLPFKYSKFSEQLNNKATKGVVWFYSTPWQRFNKSNKNTFEETYYESDVAGDFSITKVLNGGQLNLGLPKYKLKPVVKEAYDLINYGKNHGVYRVDLTQENRARKKRLMHSNAAKTSILLMGGVIGARYAAPYLARTVAASRIAVPVAALETSVGNFISNPYFYCSVNPGACLGGLELILDLSGVGSSMGTPSTSPMQLRTKFKELKAASKSSPFVMPTFNGASGVTLHPNTRVGSGNATFKFGTDSFGLGSKIKVKEGVVPKSDFNLGYEPFNLNSNKTFLSGSGTRNKVSPNRYNPCGLSDNCGYVALSKALEYQFPQLTFRNADDLYIATRNELKLTKDDQLSYQLVFPQDLSKATPRAGYEPLFTNGRDISQYTIANVATKSGLDFKFSSDVITDWNKIYGQGKSINQAAKNRFQILEKDFELFPTSTTPTFNKALAGIELQSQNLSGSYVIGSSRGGHFMNLEIKNGDFKAFDFQVYPPRVYNSPEALKKAMGGYDTDFFMKIRNPDVPNIKSNSSTALPTSSYDNFITGGSSNNVSSNAAKSNTWNEFQKQHKGQFKNASEASVAYKDLKYSESPWPIGYDYKANVRTIQVGETFNVIVNKNKAKSPGRFSTHDDIPNINYGRQKLAIKEEWKPTLDEVATYRALRSFDVYYGPVGPQIDGKNYLPGGGSQFTYKDPKVYDNLIKGGYKKGVKFPYIEVINVKKLK